VLTLLHRAAFPIELTNGNDGRGGQWFLSARTRKKIEATLRFNGHARSLSFDGLLTIHITRILGPRQKRWDADSWQRGNLKEIIDALVVLNWFIDDGPEYIQEIRFDQVATTPRPINASMAIDIYRHEKPER